MLYFSEGGKDLNINDFQLGDYLKEIIDRIGPKKRVLVIPPDFTRFHSAAGKITQILYSNYGDKLKAILPALGTHFPMTENYELFKKYLLPILKEIENS